MLLARSPGAATLRAPALAMCAAEFPALGACGRPGGEPPLPAMAVPRTDPRGAEDTYGVRSRLPVEEIDEAGGIGTRRLAPRVGGSVAFDSNGDPVNKQFTLGVIQGGRIVLPREAR